jgi:hypothetical protein
MTHFTVGIIVPEDKLPYVQGFLAEQMEPYNENTDIEPYVCYSIEQARTEIDREIKRFERIIERQAPGFDLDKCRDVLAALRGTTPEERYRDFLQHHERFNPQGEPISTYNPHGKWDWWVIGGRWDGWITDNEQSGDNGYNLSPKHQTLANNMARTEQAIARKVIPHAIITPQGEWHERGKMGWWGILITEDEDWHAQAREILARYPGDHLVIVDAHI